MESSLKHGAATLTFAYWLVLKPPPSCDEPAAHKKYPLMEPPKPDPSKGAVLAVDALSACCYGVKQKDGLPDEAAEFMGVVVSGAFPEVPREAVDEAILMRPTRSYK